jgi:predicted permease
MSIYVQTIESVLVIGVMVAGAVYLRHRGILKAGYAKVFADLTMLVIIPALIFHALSHATLTWRYLEMTGVLFAGEMVILVLARFAAGMLKLERAQMGSFILATVFGSSGLLGFALVAQLFPGSTAAMAEAAVVTALGVGLPLFTVGVMIALYYGGADGGRAQAIKNAAAFFRSPIFLAMTAGAFWSLAGLPLKGPFVGALFDGIHIMSSASTLLIALLIGVTLRLGDLKAMLPAAVASSLLKLLLLPFLIVLIARFFVSETWQMEVLLVEAAMPSALLVVAFTERYGCDTALASALVFVTLLFSTITVSLMMFLFA